MQLFIINEFTPKIAQIIHTKVWANHKSHTKVWLNHVLQGSSPMTTLGSNEHPLGFTQQWIALGIVTPESIAWDTTQISEGDDPHPEHYRWRAFERFMKTQARLYPDLAIDLFRLGESDPDHAMGGSMMTLIVRRPECPDLLLRLASESEHDHLRKIAVIRLAQNSEEAEQAAT